MAALVAAVERHPIRLRGSTGGSISTPRPRLGQSCHRTVLLLLLLAELDGEILQGELVADERRHVAAPSRGHR